MRIAGVLVALAMALGAAAAPVSVRGEAEIRAFDGTVRTPSELSDLDTIVAKAKTTLAAPGWTASLAPDARAVLRTEAVDGAFRRVLEILEGDLSLTGRFALRAGPFLLQGLDETNVELSFKDGLLRVQVGDGDAVEITGTEGTIKLKSGQVLKVVFDPKTGTFKIEVLEDNGLKINVRIGDTTIQLDKGDIVTAQVMNGELKVTSVSGQILVMGPDGEIKTVGSGQAEIVKGGAGGAVQGRGRGNRRPIPPPRKGPPKPPENDPPFKDKSDVSPS
jgi:hypothetical protein